MREGLRSGSLLMEPEIDEVSQSQVLVQKERDDSRQKGSNSIEEECLQKNLSGSGSDGKTLGLDFGGKRADLENTNRAQGSIVGGCTVVGLDSGKDNENSGIEKEVREGLLDVMDCKMQTTGRVLRSMVAVSSGCDREGLMTGSGGILVGKRITESDGSENERVMMEGHESDGSVGRLQKKLKRKRGRPPKVQGTIAEVLGEKSERVEMEDESSKLVGTLQRKLKRKRGRPPKVRETIPAPKMVLDEELLEALKKSASVEMGENERGELVERLQKKLKRKRGRPPKVPGTIAAPKTELDEEILEALMKSEQAEMKEDESGKLVERLLTKLKRKPGRPPKVPGTIAAPKVVLDEEVMGTMKKSEKEMKEYESGKLVGRSLKKLKRKRGRPPKAKEENENDGSVGRLQKKLQRKLGRTPKLWRSFGPLKVDKDNMVGGSKKSIKGTIIVGRVQRNLSKNGSHAEMRHIRKGLNAKNFISGKNKGKKRGNSKEKETEGQSRSEAKQVVRERIITLLFSAGWTVDYRPRNGRRYADAVYINPEGQTHWSVTLAYNKLKQQYEDGGDDSKTGNEGFIFSPIPEEELNMLTRVVTKKRECKKKLVQTGNDEFATGGVNNKKRQKEKLDSVVTSGCKSSKRKLKRKSLLFELDDSTVTADKGTSMAVRNFKRQEVHNRKRCALLARMSKEGASDDTDAYIPYNWKRTVLSWMIDLGIVPLNGKVQYMNQRRTATILHGSITREGIHCDCCSKILTLSKFEAHAGSKQRQQLQNIYLENGTSLLQCQLDSWNKQEESERGFHYIDVNGEDPNDDTCGICGDGGDLICCDGCPSTFHQSCLDIDKFPSGEWHCVYCSCKFCGMVGGDICQNDDSGDIAISSSATCRMCEEKYHQSCIPSIDATHDDPCSPSYCGKNCKELFARLEMLLGVKQDLEDGFSCTLIHRSDVSSDLSISGMTQKVECNSKLAVALSVMDECFLPLVDHRSGINLIRNILYNYGSNFSRLNYKGFVTAILEKDDEIISAASIRIHGNQFAEMPFIGTRHIYRRQGMCRRLLNAIESALCSANVEKLVIPAISELRQTWTSVFGFKPLEASSKQRMRNVNMLVFPGIDMLQKPLLNHPDEEMIPSPVQDLVSADLRRQQTTIEVAKNSGGRGTARPSLHFSSGDVDPHAQKANDEHAVESGFQFRDVSLLEHATDKICVTLLDGTCDNLDQLAQDANDDQNHDSGSNGPAPCGMTVGLDSQQNQHSISELESKSVAISCIEYVTTDHEGQSVHTSSEGTENAACRGKGEGSIGIIDLNTCYESPVDHSPQTVTELHDVASISQSQVSDENVVCHDSQTSNLMSSDVNEKEHHEPLAVNGSTHVPDGMILATRVLKDNLDIFPNMSIASHIQPVSTDSNPSSSCCDYGKIQMVVIPLPVDNNSQPSSSPVALPCASTGVNACSTKEAIILSNQAS